VGISSIRYRAQPTTTTPLPFLPTATKNPTSQQSHRRTRGRQRLSVELLLPARRTTLLLNSFCLTTWPWAIKPSSAVLWGVCWIFAGPAILGQRLSLHPPFSAGYPLALPYWDKEGNMIQRLGNLQMNMFGISSHQVCNVDFATSASMVTTIDIVPGLQLIRNLR
jgi:hypothetical protein